MKALKKEADERLLIEAAQKDPARFAELYEINFERVYAYVVRRVGNRAEAEDLTADVFHQALANLKRFEWRGIPFAAWLFRIAANLISDRWQRSGREVADDSGQIESAQVSPVEIEEVERRATLYPTGRHFAGGAAPGGGAAVRGTEKHQGSGAADSQDRGGSEAATVSRAE